MECIIILIVLLLVALFFGGRTALKESEDGKVGTYQPNFSQMSYEDVSEYKRKLDHKICMLFYQCHAYMLKVIKPVDNLRTLKVGRLRLELLDIYETFGTRRGDLFRDLKIFFNDAEVLHVVRHDAYQVGNHFVTNDRFLEGYYKETNSTPSIKCFTPGEWVRSLLTLKDEWEDELRRLENEKKAELNEQKRQKLIDEISSMNCPNKLLELIDKIDRTSDVITKINLRKQLAKEYENNNRR